LISQAGSLYVKYHTYISESGKSKTVLLVLNNNPKIDKILINNFSLSSHIAKVYTVDSAERGKRMTALIKKITRRWSEVGVIPQPDEDIYEYGLELLIHTILNLTVILTSAAVMGKVPESMAMLAVILPLQSYGGGYHAETHLRCFLIMYIGWWGVIFSLPYISPLAATIVAGISIVIVHQLAPVPHVNVKMSAGQRLKMRKFARITALLGGLLSIILLWGVSARVGIAISTGLGVTAFSMLVAHGKNLVRGDCR
jgi:accessory gene regulator B